MKKRICIYIITLLLTGCSTSLDAGWRALKHGDYSKAQQIAAFNLTQEPMDPEVYNLTAETYRAQGKLEESVKSARFAVSLDERNSKASSALQSAYADKASWSELCSEVERARRSGAQADDDATHFSAYHAAAQSLLAAGKAEGYPCYEILALNDSAQDLPDVARTRRAYAAKLAARGNYERASQILEKSSDPADSQLEAARYDYARNLRETAQTRIRNYVSSGGQDNHAQRSLQGAQIAQNAYDYQLADELYSNTHDVNAAYDHGVAKLHIGQKDEARTLFLKWFDADHSKKEVHHVMRSLIEYGFSDIAIEGYEKRNASASEQFETAEMLTNLGYPVYGKRLVEKFGEFHRNEQTACIQVADWYRVHKNYAEAVRWSEHAQTLGSVSNDFTLTLLSLYATTRDYEMLQKASLAYIASEPNRINDAKCEVADIYANHNDFARAAELLAEVSNSQPLSLRYESLYVKCLSKTQQFEALYAFLEPQAKNGTLNRLKFAQEFNQSPSSQKQFDAAIAQAISTENGDRYEGLFMEAEYAYGQLDNEERGDKALAKVIEISPRTDTFSRVTSFYQRYSANDKAFDTIQKWRETIPNDAKAIHTKARISLDANDFKQAMNEYDTFVEMSTNKYTAISTVITDFSNAHDDDMGFVWFERITQKPGMTMNADLEAMRGKLYTTQAKRIASTDKARSEQLRTEGLEAYKRAIDQTISPKQNVSYGADLLNTVKAPEVALLAFEAAKNSNAYTDGARRNHLQACLETNCDDATIMEILSGISENAKWNLIYDSLRNVRRIELAQKHFESDLSASKYETRAAALNELISLYLEKGEAEKIPSILKTFEDAKPDNTKARSLLARHCVRLGYVHEAIRHLTWLQIVLPDSKDNLELCFQLARRAPQNASAQSLWASQIASAQGVYHRTTWIAEIYNAYGMPQEALDVYEQALHSTDVVAENLILELLKLSIRVGDENPNERYTTLLKETALWNAGRIYELSTVYEEAGDIIEAQNMLSHALQLAPENGTYKVQKLTNALKARNSGLIMNAMNEALTSPVVAVSDPLVHNHAWLDAFDAVETYATLGYYDYAASLLINLEEPYVLTYGRNAYSRKLKSYVQNTTLVSESVQTILARVAVNSEEPSLALTELERVPSGELWAKAILNAPDQLHGLLDQIAEMRPAFSATKRERFDKAAYTTLISGENAPYALSQKYAERFMRESSESDAIHDAILKDDITDAMRRFSVGSFDNATTLQTITELAARGYQKEALDEARRHFSKLDDKAKPLAGTILAILGDDSSETRNAVSNLSDVMLQALNPETLASIATPDIIRAWLSNLPDGAMSSVYSAAMKRAAAHPDEAVLIHEDIQLSIRSHVLKSTLWLAYSRQAQLNGFFSQAVDALNEAAAILPDTQLIYTRLAACLDALNRKDEAKKALLTGENIATNVSQYWKEAREVAQNASVETRAFIVQKQLETYPNAIEPQLDLMRINLEQGNTNEAGRIADMLFTSNDISRAEKISSVYESQNAITDIPSIYHENESSLALQNQAKIDFKNAKYNDAAVHWNQAASLSLWPHALYLEGLHALASVPEAESALEQLAQLTSIALPFAPEGELWKAVISARNGAYPQSQLELDKAAKKSLDEAKTRATLLANLKDPSQFDALLKLNEDKVSRRLLAQAYLEVISETSLDNMTAEQASSHLENIDKIAHSTFVPASHADVLARMAQLSGDSARADSMRRIASLLTLLGK